MFKGKLLDLLIMWGCAASAIVLAGIILTACDPQGSTLKETHNAEGVDFTMKVHVFPNETQLNRAVKRLEGAPAYEVEGIAQARVDVIGNIRRCDIYVVKPNSSRDYSQQETWGHELMHCIYGLYHAEGQR